VLAEILFRFLLSIHISYLTARKNGHPVIYFYQHVVPAAQGLRFLPNTIGRCPVLMICGLSVPLGEGRAFAEQTTAITI
jgi:hypothetical protein